MDSSSLEVGSREWLQQPPPKVITVEEWQTRLATTFNKGGVIGPRLLPVFEAERSYEPLVDRKAPGHLQLRESFESFLYESIRLGEQARRDKGKDAPEWHGVLLLELASLFRALRAADVVFHAGYPLDGVALLRDARDRAIYLAAVGRGEVSMATLEGLAANPAERQPFSDQEWRAARKRKELTEREIMRRTIGNDSGLPPAVVEELGGWTQLFHMEVHGSRLSRASEFRDYYAAGGELSLEPVWREMPMAMFLNRFTEVAWLVNRCLPLMQLQTNGFGKEWAGRWQVMDDGLREDVASLWRMNKPISGAVTFLADAKFPFSPMNHFKEPS